MLEKVYIELNGTIDEEKKSSDLKLAIGTVKLKFSPAAVRVLSAVASNLAILKRPQVRCILITFDHELLTEPELHLYHIFPSLLSLLN